MADDLSVQSAMVYTSEKENDLYSAEGLAEFAKEQIASYNEEQGAAAEAENTEGGEKLPAALVSSSLEGQTGRLVFAYNTPEDFVKFSEENGDDTHTVTSLVVFDTEERKASGSDLQNTCRKKCGYSEGRGKGQPYGTYRRLRKGLYGGKNPLCDRWSGSNR